jgi:ABC-type phosphate transport system substrate-binding protein
VRRSITLAFIVPLTLALLDGRPLTAAADPGFVVVVHSDVQGAQIPREALSLIFFKKAPRWGDGSPVAPVDQSLRSEVRALFSKRVLGQPIVGVQSYWHKQMANGVSPPPVKSSDRDVLAYVASTPGAIGYVSSGVTLPSGVRALAVVD